jgi:hypothetical protein
MHAAYHRGPATSAASSLRDSVPATLPQLLRSGCLHALPPLAEPPPPATAQPATAPAHSTQHHPCTAGGRRHLLTAQLPPMHAANRRGPATSAAPSVRDSVSATLPQHLRWHCLHTSPTLGSPLANPHHPRRPCAQPPQPTTRNIIHAQPAVAGTRSQRKLPPMHAAYHRGPATSAASSLRGSVSATLPQPLSSDCLHAPPPLGSPLVNPATRYSPQRATIVHAQPP